MSEERNWYRVEMLSGHDTYCFFGSCQLDEEQLMQSLSKGQWVLVEDLVYFDENERAQGWAEWDPNYLARIHLNPQYVVSVMPMLEDPRKETYGANDMLTLPTVQQKSTKKAKASKKAAANTKAAAAKKTSSKAKAGKKETSTRKK